MSMNMTIMPNIVNGNGDISTIMSTNKITEDSNLMIKKYVSNIS